MPTTKNTIRAPLASAVSSPSAIEPPGPESTLTRTRSGPTAKSCTSRMAIARRPSWVGTPEIGQHLQHDRGRGQRERAADDDRRRGLQPEIARNRADRRGGHQDLRAGKRVDPDTEQAKALELELETKIKQQENHPELAEQTDRLELTDEAKAGRPDHRPADQKAEHRPEPQSLEQGGKGDKDRKDDQGFLQLLTAGSSRAAIA